MDKVIEAARQLGKALQSDERYIKYAAAQQQNDEDAALQKMIEGFTTKRGELAALTQNGSSDQARLDALNAEVRELYGQIFQNENMAHFNEAREEIGALMGFVNQIITGSQNGLDPDSIEYQTKSCGSGCSSCSGCGS